MRPHDKNSTPPTKYVGGAGHYAKRGPRPSKSKK